MSTAPNRHSAATFEHKVKLIASYGFSVGPRDPELNTDHKGCYMVVEGCPSEVMDYPTPTKDGANGPWCVVGDDLEPLVDSAFVLVLDLFHRAGEALADIQRGGSGILADMDARGVQQQGGEA